MLFIKNGRLITMGGQLLPHGDILVENGIIIDIRAKIDYTPTRTDEVIDVDDCLILPGFIDAHTHVGLINCGIGDVFLPPSAVQPLCSVKNSLRLDDIAFAECQKAGITALLTAPYGNCTVCGQCSVLNTAPTHRQPDFISKNTQVFSSYCALKLSLCANDNTALALSAIRTEFHTARTYEENHNDDNSVFNYDSPALEAYLPVLAKKIPIYIEVNNTEQIRLGLRLQKQFDLSAVFIGCKDCTEIDNELILELRDANAKFVLGSCMSNSSNGFVFANKLLSEGIVVALSTSHPQTGVQYLSMCAGISVREGLSLEDAFKTITINAAKACGMSNIIGSLEIGKQADIVIFDDCPLDSYSLPLYTIIQGRIVYRGND